MNIKRIITGCIASLSLMTATAQKYVGGDISLLTQYETKGATYYDNSGKRISAMLPWLQEQGLNAMRVRLFVDPSKAPAEEIQQGVCQDIEYVKALAKRIKAQGYALILDIHYSDSWADPAKQYTPDAWKSLNDTQLQEKVYEYTKDVLQQMIEAEATPDFIQTGNEISYGMLWGPRSSSTNSLKKYYPGQSNNRDRFIALLKKAGAACREKCPDAKIILHTERVEKPGVLTAFYNDMKAAAVDYDIIGLSYYSYYHGDLNMLSTALSNLSQMFPEKNVMIAETGYYHNWQPKVTYDLSSKYPISEAGQKLFTDDLISTLNKFNNVTGLFWWFMEANEKGINYQNAVTPSGWYNAGLFNNETGRALKALSSLKTFAEDQSAIETISPSVFTSEEKSKIAYTLDGRKLTTTPNHGIYVYKGKKIRK